MTSKVVQGKQFMFISQKKNIYIEQLIIINNQDSLTFSSAYEEKITVCFKGLFGQASQFLLIYGSFTTQQVHGNLSNLGVLKALRLNLTLETSIQQALNIQLLKPAKMFYNPYFLMKFNFLAFILMNFLQLRKLLKSELNQIRMECSEPQSKCHPTTKYPRLRKNTGFFG